MFEYEYDLNNKNSMATHPSFHHTVRIFPGGDVISTLSANVSFNAIQITKTYNSMS